MAVSLNMGKLYKIFIVSWWLFYINKIISKHSNNLFQMKIILSKRMIAPWPWAKVFCNSKNDLFQKNYKVFNIINHERPKWRIFYENDCLGLFMSLLAALQLFTLSEQRVGAQAKYPHNLRQNQTKYCLENWPLWKLFAKKS